MPQTNSLGAGPLRQHTINVDVNLLGEWLESRTKLRDDRVRWTGLLTTIALTAVVAIPILSDLAAAQRNRALKAESGAKANAAALAAVQARLAEVQPKIDSEALLTKCQSNAGAFMGEMLFVLNATSPKMAIESIEVTVLGGEVALRTKSQSETYIAAQEYVAAAGKGDRVKSAILSTARQNGGWGPDGVTFEFAKKVEVVP